MRNSFEASEDQFYTPMNQEILEKSIQQLNSRKGKKHELIEAEDDGIEIAQCRTHYNDK